MKNKNTKIKFFKSLRFRLTLFYSLVLFVFSALFVLGLNIYLNNYLKRDPSHFPEINGPLGGEGPILTFRPNPSDEFIPFSVLSIEEQARIHQIRLTDLMRVQQLSLISLFPVALLSFLVGYYISGKFLNPLAHLKGEVDRANAAQLGKQIPIKSEDEIGSLIKSYNEMSLRLKGSFDSQSQFVQDASHELRTPLTVIRTNLDTALDDCNATKEELKGAITKALEGMDSVQKLSDDLLELSLPQKVVKEKVDLVELVKGEVSSLMPYAKERGVKLNFTTTKPKILLNVAREQVGRAVCNLIDNAIKYSKNVKNPEVLVSVDELGGKVIIRVKDNGVGIAEAEQKNIFKRFYRIDKSRNSKTGGFGLGLSIMKKIVEEHNGEVTVKSKKGDTEFSIILPKGL